MTLISAWRCHQGIVVNGDSQETVGSYRATVDKVKAERIGPFSVIGTGAGDANLVQSFMVRLRRQLATSTDGDLQRFVVETENALQEFHANDVALSPLNPDDKALKFIFSAFSPSTGKYDAWVSRGITLERINTFELAGWEEPLYRNVASRLYQADMTIAQAILAGVYLLTVAEQSSNYIRGPFRVSVVRSNGIQLEREEYVKEMEARLEHYEKMMNRLFLQCADTEVLPSVLRKSLADFSSEVMFLHVKHIGEIIYRMLQGGIGTTNEAHSQIPLGTTIDVDEKGKLKGFYFPEEP